MCIICTAQVRYKFGISRDGNYTLVEGPNGLLPEDITLRIQRSLGGILTDELADILDGSIQARRAGNNFLADELEREWQRIIRMSFGDPDRTAKYYPDDRVEIRTHIRRLDVLGAENILMLPSEPDQADRPWSSRQDNRKYIK